MVFQCRFGGSVAQIARPKPETHQKNAIFARSIARTGLLGKVLFELARNAVHFVRFWKRITSCVIFGQMERNPYLFSATCRGPARYPA